MFSEILKIIPKLDDGTLAAMEKALNSRFMRVAKKFGGGIMSVLKGGGIVGAAIGLIDKILNPLQEVQEAIDKTLTKANDLVTNAKQFGTTSGRLAVLTALAKSTGLEAESLFMLIQKFQTAVAEAKADPTKPSSVANFINEKDSAEGFFKFIQQLKKMDVNQQVLVQQQVFGEKQILKMSEFLNTDFTKKLKLIGAKPGDSYTPDLEKLGGLKDLTDALTQKRELGDISKKARLINEDMIRAKDSADQAALDKENKNIANYQNLRAIADASAKIQGLVQDGLNLLGSLISKVTGMASKIEELVNSVKNSRLLKFGKGWFGGGD